MGIHRNSSVKNLMLMNQRVKYYYLVISYWMPILIQIHILHNNHYQKGACTSNHLIKLFLTALVARIQLYVTLFHPAKSTPVL